MRAKDRLEEAMVERLKSAGGLDIAERHCAEDETLCGLLTELGYGRVVEQYKKTTKWYA